MKFTEIMFVIISLFLAGFLYFHKLNEVPSGFYVDEATVGYNAYSILLTGKDEYGKEFPILFRSLGLYISPLYTYLTVAPLKFFGLNIFSVRFVASCAGLISAIILFFFVKSVSVFKNKKSPFVGLILFLITPWIYFYSRIGYEISLGFFLFSLGALFLWLALREKRFLILSSIVISISIYSTPFNRLIAPLLIVFYLIVFKKEVNKNFSTRYLLVCLFLFFIIQLPNLSIVFTPAFFVKSDLFFKETVFNQAQKIGHFFPAPLAISFSFIREFLSKYLVYFSPRSLFFLGDPDPQRSIPELSVFYFWMIIPYLLGLYFILKEKRNKFFRFVILLSFIGPIPASLTRDPFSTHRAIPLLLPLFLTILVGIDRVISVVDVKVLMPTILALFVFSLLLLWRSYFVFLPKERTRAWGGGFADLADFIRERGNTKFVIDQARIKPAYIELAFFLKYPPNELQKRVNQDIKKNYYANTEFDSYYNFENIETRNIDWKVDGYKKQILVGDEFTFSDQQAKEHFLEKTFEIRDPLGEIVFVGYETNPFKKCSQDPNNINCKEI